jgi:hypothetical protein
VTGLSSGAVTFLFSDIEGSTALVKALRDSCQQVLAEHRDPFRAAIAELTLMSGAPATRPDDTTNAPAVLSRLTPKLKGTSHARP